MKISLSNFWKCMRRRIVYITFGYICSSRCPWYHFFSATGGMKMTSPVHPAFWTNTLDLDWGETTSSTLWVRSLGGLELTTTLGHGTLLRLFKDRILGPPLHKIRINSRYHNFFLLLISKYLWSRYTPFQIPKYVILF